MAARVHIGTHHAIAIAPAGASTGSHEALFLRDGGDSYDGKGVQQAIERFAREVSPSLIGLAGNDFYELDRALRTIDSSATQSRYGGHIPVAITIAAWLAYAKQSNSQPFEVIAAHLNCAPVLPMPMVSTPAGHTYALSSQPSNSFISASPLAEIFIYEFALFISIAVFAQH